MFGLKRKLDDIGLVLVVLVLIMTGIFLVLPIGMAVLMSFDSRTFLGPFPPPSFSISWYKKFFTNDGYLLGLQTSLTLAAMTATVSTILGVSAAVVLDRYRFNGRELFVTFFLSPLMVPGVVIGFALLLFFSIMGHFGGFFSLLVGHVIITLPYTIRTSLAGLAGIKSSLTEAALILGANERQAFWDVTFPLGKTGMVAGGIFAFAFSMDEVAASIFLTTPKTSTLPVAMISMMRSSFDLSIAAGAVCLVAFTGFLIFILDRIAGLETIIGSGQHR